MVRFSGCCGFKFSASECQLAERFDFVMRNGEKERRGETRPVERNGVEPCLVPIGAALASMRERLQTAGSQPAHRDLASFCHASGAQQRKDRWIGFNEYFTG